MTSTCFTCRARCRQVPTESGFEMRAVEGAVAQTLAPEFKACPRCGAPNSTQSMVPAESDGTQNA